MNENNQDSADVQVEQIESTLVEYRREHAKARIDVRRRSSVSIRIRIIDPEFEGMARVDREPAVWKLLETLPEDVFCNVTMLLLLTPKEAKSSLANLEFEDPIPSRL